MAALSATGSAGNAAAISASLQGVNAAAANNTSIDGAKLTNSLTELNKSNADLVKAQNEVTKDYIQNQGKGIGRGTVHLRVERVDKLREIANNWPKGVSNSVISWMQL